MKNTRLFTVMALDPETSEKDKLGTWLFDEKWVIGEVKGIGEYQEMLDEIAEEVNEMEDLDDESSDDDEQIERHSPKFLPTLQAYLKEYFDLEIEEVMTN